jgi:hypothetical protein
MLPHPIRLRHPWDELPGASPEQVVYCRRFNRPTGMDTWERISLEIDRGIFAGQISLNGTVLGLLRPGEFFAADVTALLEPVNELRATVDRPTQLATPPASASVYIVDPDEPLGSPIGDVRLVIRIRNDQ